MSTRQAAIEARAAAKEAKAKLAAARAEKEAAQVAPAQVAALLGVVVWKGA